MGNFIKCSEDQENGKFVNLDAVTYITFDEDTIKFNLNNSDSVRWSYRDPQLLKEDLDWIAGMADSKPNYELG